MNEHCCEKPRRVDAPVDCEFPESGIRLRHLPGNICLHCKDIWLPNLEPSPGLVRSISGCLQANPSHLNILKAVPRIDERQTGREARREGCVAAYLDIGIGENAGLVVERVKGSWNARTHEGFLPDDGIELRIRLSQLDRQAGGRLIPSLAYDTPDHPRSVQIELTTRCNLSCAYCTHQYIPLKADIPMDRLDRILDQIDFSEVQNIDFTGLGEPVLHPALPEIISKIRARNSTADIRIVTNGTALTQHKTKAICEAGITSIAFSIDSVNPDRFAKSRGGGNLEKVLANLTYLVAYRKEHQLSGLQIKIKAVLIDNLFQEAMGLLELSAALGIGMPHFSCLDRRSNVRQHYQQDWLQDELLAGDSAAFLQWAEQTWQQLTGGAMPAVDGQAGGSFINPLIAPPSTLCRWAIDAAYISATGDMLSCCEQMIDLPRKYHGTVLTNPLRELWQKDLLWNYRLPLSLGIAPLECEGCTWAPAALAAPAVS